MRFTKKIPYNIRRVLPILGIAGASMFSACSNDDEPQRDVELYFAQQLGTMPSTEEVQKLAEDKSVRNIYLCPDPTETWTNLQPFNLTYLRKRYLEDRLRISPKVRGRGNFRLTTGVASEVPEDSLWYELNGWTINIALRQQKQK